MHVAAMNPPYISPAHVPAEFVEREKEIALAQVKDTGKPIQETIAVDVLSGADCIEYFAGLARTIAGEHHDRSRSTARSYTWCVQALFLHSVVWSARGHFIDPI